MTKIDPKKFRKKRKSVEPTVEDFVKGGRELEIHSGDYLLEKPTGIYFRESQKPFLKHLAVDLDSNTSMIVRALVARFKNSYEQAEGGSFEPIDVQDVLNDIIAESSQRRRRR